MGTTLFSTPIDRATSRSRSKGLARESRDITVPIGTFRIPATSS